MCNIYIYIYIYIYNILIQTLHTLHTYNTLIQTLSGFCHFGLGLFMVLWQSPDTPVMSCFHVSARGFDCAWAVCSLVCVPCFVLERGVWILALMSWDSVFVSGYGHSHSVFCHCVSARSRVRSIARSHVHVCFVELHAVRVSIGCVHSCYILCCVARSLCISLAACFHVVMCEHVAYEFSH